MLRLTKEQNEKLDKLLASKVTQKGHFMTLGDAARLIKEKLGKPEQELEEHQGEQPLETRKQTRDTSYSPARRGTFVRKTKKQFKDTVFNVGSREVDKHGSHDQRTHGGGRRGGGQVTDPAARRRANLPTTDERKVLIFAAKYPKGWHGYAQDKRTVRAVEEVARRGDLEISRETNQFRLKRRKKVTKALTIDEARERHATLRGNKVTKGKITHTRAYQEVKDKPGVKTPHALAQHIVEEAGGEPKKKVSKHGQHDQRTHSPTGRAAIGRERAARSVTSAAERAVQRVGEVTEATRSKAQSIISDIDTVLDGIDAGSRLHNQLKEAKTAIQEWNRRRKERKSNKFLKAVLVKVSSALSKEIEKGIKHSIDTLTESLSFIEEQTPNKPLGDKKEKELKEVIEELSGVATYLMDVKDKGSFSKKTKVGKHGSHDQSSHAPKGQRSWSSTDPIPKPPKVPKEFHRPNAGRVADSMDAAGSKPGEFKEMGGSVYMSTVMPMKIPGTEDDYETKLRWHRASGKDARRYIRERRQKVSKKDGLSWTTPAVADSIRRQRHRPNPKGRGVQGYNK